MGISRAVFSLLGDAALRAERPKGGGAIMVVPTDLLDVLLRLPAACVEVIDVRERKVRTTHSPEDFVAAEIELRDLVARTRAIP